MKRSATINQFLNVSHNRTVRAFVGTLLAAFTLVATFQPILAREMFRRAYQYDQFKTAFRRASFYGRRGWTKINLSVDLVYVFASNLSLKELEVLRRFLESRARHQKAGVIDGDLSYVSAMQMIQSWGTTEYYKYLGVFEDDVNRILIEIRDGIAPNLETADQSAIDSFDLQNASRALSAFSNFMASKKYPWFVLSGTLLGIVREGGFLSHDYDIDVGLYGDEIDIVSFEKDIRRHPDFYCGNLDTQVIFEKDENGRLRTIEKPVFLKIAHTGGIHIDLFFHYITGDTTWHASSLFRWDNSNFDLISYELAGTEVQGPEDADRYLTENYGDWRTPVTRFHSALDTTNQQVVSNPLSVAIFLRRIWLAKSQHPDAARSLLGVLIRRGFVENNGLKFCKAAFMDDLPTKT